MNKKILVVANKCDLQAKELVKKWSHQACLVTPENLSVKGWRYNTEDVDNSISIANGLPLVSHNILGVFTRMHSVLEDDLPHIVPAERAYVASEMSAFLLAWLFALKCPVLNRPTPTSLSGPYWRQEKWISTATRLGIPVAPSRRRAIFTADQILTPENGGVAVTIVGRMHFGNIDPVLVRYARTLADAAGVDLLSVRFSGNEPDSVFMGAGFDTGLISEDMADAIFEYFQEKSNGRPEMES
ncbi:Uncharacterised protein [uncultured archaeon]|nr:Uncharacterised protein [uncultured archaeon]